MSNCTNAASSAAFLNICGVGVIAALRQARAALVQCNHVPGVTEQAICAADAAIAQAAAAMPQMGQLLTVSDQLLSVRALAASLATVDELPPAARSEKLAGAANTAQGLANSLAWLARGDV